MFRIFIIVFCFFGHVASAQSWDTASLKKHYLKIYNQALNYNDVTSAIGALQGYIAETNDYAYKDTLSMLFFSSKSYVSALLLAEEVCKQYPLNTLAMARAAECYDELGDPKTAVMLFEKVAPKTNNPYHYYKLAIGQYQLKRITEAEASARIVVADTASKSVGVNFMMDDGSQQAVPVNAAASNLLGVIQMDAKNYAAAKPHFQEALKLFPNFSGAKQNLAAVENKLKTTKPAVPAKPKG